MGIDFYYHPYSPPCRAVLLVARAIGVDLKLIKVDVLQGHQMKEEFLAINPQHTVPTLVDGSVVLWESRAICTYLVAQYAKDDALYPNDARVRCIVDARLYFDMGSIFQRWFDYVAPPVMNGFPASPANLKRIHEALDWFNTMLAQSTFAAGNKVTVADMSLVATVSTMEAAGVRLNPHPRVVKWLHRCQTTIPGYQEANGESASEFGAFVKGKIEAAAANIGQQQE